MGLDMYVRKIKKGPKFDGIVTTKELDEAGLYFIMAEDVKAEYWFSQVEPFMTLNDVEVPCYNFEKIAKDFEMDSPYVSGWESGMGKCSVTISDSSAAGKTVRISGEDIEQKYTIKKMMPAYVYFSEEVDYWRKDYEAQKIFYELFNNEVENCGFYRITDDILDRFNAYCNVDLSQIPLDKDEALFYHEWY